MTRPRLRLMPGGLAESAARHPSRRRPSPPPPDAELYERIYAGMCMLWHPAVAAVEADAELHHRERMAAAVEASR